MKIEEIKNNHNKTIELLDAQQSTIEHLQEKVKVLTEMLKTYQKAYGGIENASLAIASNMMAEHQEDDFCPDPSEIL